MRTKNYGFKKQNGLFSLELLRFFAPPHTTTTHIGLLVVGWLRHPPPTTQKKRHCRRRKIPIVSSDTRIGIRRRDKVFHADRSRCHYGTILSTTASCGLPYVCDGRMRRRPRGSGDVFAIRPPLDQRVFREGANAGVYFENVFKIGGVGLRKMPPEVFQLEVSP